MFYMEYNEVYRQAKEEGFFAVDFLFTDGVAYRELAPEIFSAKEAEQEICILQNPMTESMNVDGAIVVNKPLYTLNFCQVINHETTAAFVETDNVMNFTAPQAQILARWQSSISRQTDLIWCCLTMKCPSWTAGRCLA